MADIKYLIEVDTKNGTVTLKEFDGALDSLGKQSGKTAEAHKGLWAQVAIGQIAYNALAKSVEYAKDFLIDSAKAAGEAEKADRALSAALEITGRPVENLARHFKDFAGELQKSTVYDNEAIKGAQALMLQLTNLDKNGIDRATKGAIGLASVFDMDLQSAAQLVAKAMAGNESVLSRYGIQVDKTKSAEEQRAQILEKLEQFYGRATSETVTYSGQVEQLKNKYGELKEAVGAYIIKNNSLIPTLNKLIDATIYYLTLNDRLKQQQEDYAKTEHQLWREIWDAVYATNADSQAINDLSKKYDGNVALVLRAIRTNKDYAQVQEALNRVRREEISDFAKQQKALAAAERGTNKYEKEVKDATKAEKKYADILYDMPGAYRSVKVSTDQMIPSINSLDIKVLKLGNDFLDMTATSAEAGLWWSQETIDTFNAVKDSAMDITSQIGNLFQALSDRKMAILDREYQEQKYAIEQSNKSEEEKYIALSQLEEEYQGRAEAIRVAAAKKQKKVQYAMAVMDAAGAVVNALNTHPFIPAGLIAAATATVMGALQVATIASTPLARGGIFKQPTLLAGADGGAYQVAEAGEKEVVAPLSGLRRELGLDRSRNQQPIVLENYIYLDGQKLEAFVVRTIEKRSRSGNLKVNSKALS